MSDVHSAWSEWFPTVAVNFHDFSISAGDSITVTVIASSRTEGTAILTNNSKGKTVTKLVSSPQPLAPLCEQNAEWIVEDFGSDGELVSFVDFGEVIFTGASARTASGFVSPSNATIIDIKQNNKTLTSASTSDSSVTVTYI